MKTAVNQPTFFSWLGYFECIDYVDNFVFLDNVKFGNKPKRITRNIVADEDGNEFIITISISKPSQQSFLNECKIIKDKNYLKSKNLIFELYKKSKFFKEVSNTINKIYSFESDYLVDFNINLIKQICELIGIKCNFYKSSEDFNFKSNLTNAEYYNKIADTLNSTAYCTFSTGFKEGLYSSVDFSTNEKKFLVQEYQHPVYARKNKFVSYMSILDLLFNDLENALSIARSGSCWINFK